MLYSGWRVNSAKNATRASQRHTTFLAGDYTVKHVNVITKTPLIANEDTTDLSFILGILGVGLDLLTTFVGAFSAIFEGLLTALATFNGIKNPSTT